MSVYYVHSPETGLVKIGFAADATHRLSKIRSDSPTRLVMLAIEPGDKTTEAARHARFEHLRQRGEWFRYASDLADFISALQPYVYKERKLAGPLGEWIRANNHTLGSFAELVGTSVTAIHRTCGGSVPRRDLLLRIVEATDWAVDANAICGVPPRPARDIAA